MKYLVKYVGQFPSDSELCRYIATVTDQVSIQIPTSDSISSESSECLPLQEVLSRCHECMNVIVSAKDRQAAQANQAADALIAQIEAEVNDTFSE